jgi:choice-of-anchor C domain-containing protein
MNHTNEGSIMKKIFWLIALIVPLLFVTSSFASSFTNGSFESALVDPESYSPAFVNLGSGSTAINGWTVTGNLDPITMTTGIDYVGSYWKAYDGTRSIDLNHSAAGGISQTFDTVVGRVYTVSFALAGNFDPTPWTGENNNFKLLSVSVSNPLTNVGIFGNAYLVNKPAAGWDYGRNPGDSGLGWMNESFTFTAVSTSSTLAFNSVFGSLFGPVIDNVTLTYVPEPYTISLLGLGLVGLAFLRRRFKN